MSTVVLDTITGKSTATTITIGSTPVVSSSANSMTIRGEGSNQTSIQQGLCKAWCRFDSDTGADIDDSLNVASLTDVNVGRTTGSYTTNFGNANYSGVPHSPAGGTGYTSFGTQVVTIFGSRTTSAFGIASYSDNDSAYKDSNLNDVVIFGDLS